jgi:hypothetical protein
MRVHRSPGYRFAYPGYAIHAGATAVLVVDAKSFGYSQTLRDEV